jgi:hypothetical protein
VPIGGGIQLQPETQSGLIVLSQSREESQPELMFSVLQHLSDEEIKMQLLQQGSGKMVLLSKLLPKLKQGGHKVLIFSQVRPNWFVLRESRVLPAGSVRGSELFPNAICLALHFLRRLTCLPFSSTRPRNYSGRTRPE